jgi:Na+/melibiose symporter-like transporter
MSLITLNGNLHLACQFTFVELLYVMLPCICTMSCAKTLHLHMVSVYHLSTHSRDQIAAYSNLLFFFTCSFIMCSVLVDLVMPNFWALAIPIWFVTKGLGKLGLLHR